MSEFIKSLFPRPFKFMASLVGSGDPRVHGCLAVMIATTLCVGLLWIIFLIGRWHPLLAELTVIVTAISTIGTIIYKRGKASEDAKNQENPNDPNP